MNGCTQSDDEFENPIIESAGSHDRTAHCLLGRMDKDSSKAALEAVKKALEEARRTDARLQEIEIEIKLQKEKLAEIRKLDKAVKEVI